MMNSVSSSLSNPAVAQSQAVNTAKAPVAQASAESQAAVTVELSDAAQAKELKQEGYGISDISSKLGLDKDTVSSYLNIKA
jgi:hypothetical protein